MRGLVRRNEAGTTVHEWHEAMRKAYGDWQAVLSEGKAQKLGHVCAVLVAQLKNHAFC